MSEKSDAPQRTPTVLAVPESAHIELVQLRDHLRLMAQLTAVGSNASRHDARLRPDALAWWFSRLHKDVDLIVAAPHYSSVVATAHHGSGHVDLHARDQAR